MVDYNNYKIEVQKHSAPNSFFGRVWSKIGWYWMGETKVVDNYEQALTAAQELIDSGNLKQLEIK